MNTKTEIELKGKADVKKLALCGMFIALSFIGANIKVFGTIAFDSLPAFLAAMMLGPVYGAVIGAAGHILTSMLSGFPFGFLVHVVIAVAMGITMVLFYGTYNYIFRKNLPFFTCAVAAGVVGVVFNGAVTVFALMPLLNSVLGREAVIALIMPLSIVSAANITAAFAIYKVIKNVLRER